MGGFSLTHLLILGVFLAPIFLIVKKAGFAPWWALLAFVPIVNLIALWIFALIEWPRTGVEASTFE